MVLSITFDTLRQKCFILFLQLVGKKCYLFWFIDLRCSKKEEKLGKVEMTQRRILRVIFFKRKYYSLVDTLQHNQILSVFELYLVELIEKLFRQFQKNPTIFLPQLEFTVISSITTRFQRSHSLPLARGRTLIKRK